MTRRKPGRNPIKSKTARTGTRPKVQKPALRPGLKNVLISISIWGLVAINIVLIMSMVYKLLNKSELPNVNIIDKEVLDVEVLNGCGVKGVANIFAELLKRENLDVVNVANAERFDYELTLVIDRRAVSRENAYRVAELLGVDKENVYPMVNTSVQLDVTVIIGADYKNLKAYDKLR